MKLVINSYAPWSITRSICVESLIQDAKYKNFEKIILVLGGSQEEIPPTFKSL